MMQKVNRKPAPKEVKGTKKPVQPVQKTVKDEPEVLPQSPFGPFLFRMMSAGPMGFMVALGSVYGAEEKTRRDIAPKRTTAQKIVEGGLVADDVITAFSLIQRCY